ncbi:MAG TPA: PQQ-dependent sugar dehydrogenase [Thermoanaerobaculia bacterium]|nr:PQQ-dependent sugar dehydrogenase [Thermoanaerobaculia bacterium]
MIRSLALVSLLLLSLPALAQEIALETVIPNGLQLPVAVTHAGDSRLFITQQRGTIVIWDGTRVLPAPFLDITGLVLCCNERGLLSVAFHPQYAQNGFFYVNYTETAGPGQTVIARYRVSASDPNRADPASAKVLLRIPQPFENHNGGQLQFGPDGYLYIGMGDGGSGGDPGNRAQNLTNFLGKILRIDVNSGDPYGIPPSNPFLTGGRPEIWAYGMRNPWRFSFDRATGDLWIADVGQGLWEEIDFQPSTSIGGENYGWRLLEGTHCFNPATGCDNGSTVKPVIEYNHSGGACSVTGGYVYRGTRYPRLGGTYIYGDYCNGVIWGAPRPTNGTAAFRVLLDTPYFISTFGEDFNGEIYMADYGAGRLFHIIDPRPPAAKRRSARH